MATSKTTSRSRSSKSSSSSSSAQQSKSSGSSSSKQTLRAQFADWPRKGYDGPQPWDHDALDFDPRKVGAGERDQLSPVDPRPGLPLLAIGMAGEAVRELGQRLADAGYPSSIVGGDNPFAVFDATVMRAVEQFRSDYGLQEAPTEALGGDTDQGRQRAAAHVGPYTQEALLRVSERAREQQAKDDARGVSA